MINIWDSNGDGYARGKGLVAVVLKRLREAIADGDPIECPNPVAQANLIRQTYAKARIDLDHAEDRSQYFEAHGTGKKVGDLNEATAIQNTFFNSNDAADHYIPCAVSTPNEEQSHVVSLPFVFSAGSERSLASMLFDYSQYLDTNPATDTVGELRSKLEAELERKSNGKFGAVSSTPNLKPLRVLGIFTGQGAQWAAMGAQFISSSLLAWNTLSSRERCLAEMPAQCRPEWSICAGLAAAGTNSRVIQAAFSQPLYTALQIILVDRLRIARISFAAVVGHSSGEIAAAYAAGFLSAETALKIAYLRGLFAHLAGGGTAGGMLPVGMSMSEGQDFCQSVVFRDRIEVAASNAPNSVTSSGDADAITEASEYFEANSIFARKLRVDTVYHSHHMITCSEQYLNALNECGVQLGISSNETCIWYSSAREGQFMALWENLQVNTGQITCSASMQSGPIEFAIEVGAHLALKGPASRTLQEVFRSKKEIPYTGLLVRDRSAMKPFAFALGLLWTHFGGNSFLALPYAQLFSHNTKFQPIKNLPTYPRTSPDSTENQCKWRNYIHFNELPWLEGHHIQNQVIFPAAMYAVIAFEAASSIATSKEKIVASMEVKDLKILHAIGIGDNASGVYFVRRKDHRDR